MNWGSWQAFWHMGGYGLYVWSAYGVTALMMVAEVLRVRARLRRAAEAARALALNPEMGE
ncbi:heme exporter protein CcmD [Ideonella sp. DXS22W]|uniref:Heme exporter protein D n=1 Tax=Pseudaquabacterium inlustre TaxID=2984192 RepID=A0ABU9CD07_9BURK